jgi:hypothetical protein
MSARKMYSVVHFPEENAVEAVPSDWLVDDDTAVLWPPKYNDSALYKARLNGEPPNPVTWQKFTARRLGGSCKFFIVIIIKDITD